MKAGFKIFAMTILRYCRLKKLNPHLLELFRFVANFKRNLEHVISFISTRMGLSPSENANCGEIRRPGVKRSGKFSIMLGPVDNYSTHCTEAAR